MKRRGVWVGRGLIVLGLAAALIGIAHALHWGLWAAAGGFAAALGLSLGALVRSWRVEASRVRPADFPYVLDLLRRAHGADAGWAVGMADGDVEVGAEGDVGPGRDPGQRGAAIAQLASADGRAHVVRDGGGTYVAVGDFPFGAGLLFAGRDPAPEAAAAALDELRRLVAGLRLAQSGQPETPGHEIARQLAAVAAGAQTLEGIAKAGAEVAQRFSHRGAVVVTQDQSALQARVLAVSSAADKRLVGLALAAEAPVRRAILSAVPVVARDREDVFGPLPGVPDRRRAERAGTAFPLLDGHVAIGALVLVGPPVAPDGPLAAQIQRLVAELGPRLAAARAVHEAEQRAVLDPLTGLANRRAFERQLERHETLEAPPSASLIYADLDRFKALNDTLGHAAGDAALRHVARILETASRDGDLVARIGGEEFALWLPTTPLAQGLEVAERVRRSVEAGTWHWSGTPHPMTVSCGVAGYPDSVRDLKNLRAAADAALYRAKQAGRNRVEKASAGD